MRLSNFTIALVIVSVVAITFSLILVNYTDIYGKEYDNSTLDTFKETSEIRELAIDMQNSTTNQEPSKSNVVVDIVGDYISKAVSTLKIGIKSLNLFDSMTNEATDRIGLPAYFKAAMYTIMIILIILGVIVSAMIKKDV